MFLAFMLSNPMLQEWPNVQWFLEEIARKRNIDPDKALKKMEQVVQERAQKMQMDLLMNGVAPPGNGGAGEATPVEEGAMQ